MQALTDLRSHYEFGRNWRDFAKKLDATVIEEAIAGLERLAPAHEIAGYDVLDIGCGSGVHALAALKLGARSVVAVDIDPDSVATTKDVLTHFAPPSAQWSAEVRSVFDLSGMPMFPIVYSWGVLHHTGSMRRAIEAAAQHVAPGGRFIVALYRRTPLCGAWRLEKWLYTNAPGWMRACLEGLYVAGFGLGLAVTGRSLARYRAEYVKNRGMDWMTDVRDWLGGYPYESISEREMLDLAVSLGFQSVRRFCRRPGLGVFGTGCDEYAFIKSDDPISQ